MAGNPHGGNLTEDPSYIWADGDVYKIDSTDEPEGAAASASFSGLGVDNEPHQVLLNKIKLTHTVQGFIITNVTALLARNTWTNFQAFVGPTSGMFVVPDDVFFVKLVAVGAGGGGAGSNSFSGNFTSGGGGGAGGYAESIVAVNPGDSLHYSIGAGGAGGGPGSGGQQGGASSVNNNSVGGAPLLIDVTGGVGAVWSSGGSNSAGAAGGIGIVGRVLATGGAGDDGEAAAAYLFAGNGAPGPWGGAGRAINSDGDVVQNAKAPGAGGGGGYGGSVTAGNGGPGIVLIYW